MFLIEYESYTGAFTVTFLYVHVLYPGLVHLLHYSPSSPTPLHEMILIGFSVSYLYICKKYINHAHLPLPSLFTLPLLLVASP
jgi:hypothetical protein